VGIERVSKETGLTRQQTVYGIKDDPAAPRLPWPPGATETPGIVGLHRRPSSTVLLCTSLAWPWLLAARPSLQQPLWPLTVLLALLRSHGFLRPPWPPRRPFQRLRSSTRSAAARTARGGAGIEGLRGWARGSQVPMGPPE
jgi:hypothetical protein